MRPPVFRVRYRAAWAALALGFMTACSAGPRAIVYDRDGCAYCLMQITDARYAAELVTHTGKVSTFDSIECLVSYYQTLDATHRDAVETLWVSDYTRPGTLISATSARFLRVTGPGSPMGRGMLAVGDSAALAPLQARASEPPMTWRDVLALAEREHWATRSPDHPEPSAMDMGGSTGGR